MALSHTQPDQKPVSSEPTYHKVHRAILAACIVLAPLVIFLGFIVDPTFGVPRGAQSIFVAFRAVSPSQIQWFLFFNAVTPFFFPLSYIGLGLLAMKRSPWLATLSILFGLIGSLPWGTFVTSIAQADVMAKMGNATIFAEIWNHTSAERSLFFLQLCWVIGHLLGYVLVGIALARSRAIPLWAASLVVIGVPLQMIAYPTQQGIFQILGFICVFIGSIPAAFAMLRGLEQVTFMPILQGKE